MITAFNNAFNYHNNTLIQPHKLSYAYELVINKLAIQRIQSLTHQQSSSMFLSVPKKPSIGQSLFDQSLDSLPIGLTGIPFSLILHLVALSSNVLHLEPLPIQQKPFIELLGPHFLLIFLIFKDGLPFESLDFLFACQSQNLFKQQRSILVDESKQLVSSLIFSLLLSDIDASSITEWQNGLTLIMSWRCGIIFHQRETLLPHLDQLASDLFEITTQTNYLLESSQTGKVVEMSLVVDEKVTHLV